ncbi:hypothetical protein TUBRATIS_27490 [Tubulinosema ratisbonensis]|uniref:Uncharacterized protein n=1 Tax=Tubulinosema ratisbonensis TaxID=291195 RepID=A0A437AIA9_9MICR|nr:hypothetical protein TUBRATIS_27490 [Tubulinosema ratisbonensis]
MLKYFLSFLFLRMAKTHRTSNKQKTQKKSSFCLQESHIQNSFAKILHLIDEFILIFLISFIFVKMYPNSYICSFFIYYIALKIVNLILCYFLTAEYLNLKKILSTYRETCDNILKLAYFLILFWMKLNYIIIILSKYFAKLDKTHFIFFIYSSIISVFYLIVLFLVLRQYLEIFYQKPENIKLYSIHSFLSKIYFMKFLYLIFITGVLYSLRFDIGLFYIFYISLCYIGITLTIPLFFYKKMCLKKQIFLTVVSRFYIKLYFVFLFNCVFFV